MVEDEKKANGIHPAADEAVDAVPASIATDNGCAADATPVAEKVADAVAAPADDAVDAPVAEETEKVAEVVEATNGDSTGN